MSASPSPRPPCGSPLSTLEEGNATMSTPSDQHPDPLDAREYDLLEALRVAFARGGVSRRAARTPADDARIAAAITLDQLLRVLEAYREASLRGEPVILEVGERGGSPRRIVMDIALVRVEGVRP